MAFENYWLFMVYLPNKFGLEFWVLVEVENKYVVSILPY